MKRHVFLILTLLIGLALSHNPVICYAQSDVLQTSSQWQLTENVLVQKNIDVNQERAPSESSANEIVVKFKAGVSQAAIDQFHAQIGVTVLHVNASARFMRVRIPAGKTVNQILNLYRQNMNVLYAEPVYYFKTKFTPDDPKYIYQWNLHNPFSDGINMEKAWDITMGNKNVIVAIVDTGVAYESYYDQNNYYYQSRDLYNTNFVTGYDFVNNDTHPNDDHWHGTFVAGIIAQSTNNNLGTAGVAPAVSIMPVKVLDKEGHGSTVNIAEGIIWAADHGAHVVNLSLGGPEPSLVIEDACAYAYNKGVTIVCAAGNRGTNSLVYPAAYNDYCIAVGATRLDEMRAYYSDHGPGLDLVAPGGDVQVDQNRDKIGDGIVAMTFGPKGYNNWVYLFAHGTSMATAHISGVAALILSQGIAKTPAQVRQVLQETAQDRGPSGYDLEYGWGLVDAYAALSYRFPSQGAGTSQTAAGATSTSQEQDSTSTTSTAAGTSASSGIGTAEGTSSETSSTTTPAASSPPMTPVEMEIASAVQSMITKNRPTMPSYFRRCGCRYYEEFLTPQSAYQTAHVVFVGKLLFDIVETRDIDGNSLLDWQWRQHKYVFQVLKNYKGANTAEIKLYHKGNCIYVEDDKTEWPLPKGALGTCAHLDMCSFPFLRHEKYLIYAVDRQAYVCMRIFPIAEAADDLKYLDSLK